MEEVGLSLADSKTEIMMANRKRTSSNLTFRVGSEQVNPAPTLKYLGVIIDNSRNFRTHIVNKTNKAIEVMAALAGLMPNVGPLKFHARKMYYQIMESIVMYGAPAWEKAVYVGYNRKTIRNTQKIGLGRMASAYRSTPVDTLCVIVGKIPWELLAKERSRLYEWEETRRRTERHGLRGGTSRTVRGQMEEFEEGGWVNDRNERMPDVAAFVEQRPDEPRETRERAIKNWLKREARKRTMEEWKVKWRNKVTGKWTRKLIPDPGDWVIKKHHDLDYFVTQALTGHGVFNAFRKCIGKTVSDKCWFHESERDDVEHTMIKCSKWEEERTACIRELGFRQGITVKMEEILQKATETGSKWKVFKEFCKQVLKEKARIEKQRENEGLDGNQTRLVEEDLESGDVNRMREL